MRANSASDLDLLSLGEPPEDTQLLDRLTVGVDMWEAFAVQEYLERYIADGGSQFKLLIGRPGSGKTHLLRRLERAAHDLGYIVAAFPADSVRLQRIDDLYRAIVNHLDLVELTRRLANRVISRMGYDPERVPDSLTFVDWVVQEGRIRELVARQTQEQLEGFFRRRRIDTSLCLAYIQLSAAYLGIRAIPAETQDTLYDWIRGEPLKAAALGPLLIRRPIDRYNARVMLDSLSRLARELDFKGVVVTIDRLEDIVTRIPETGRWKYTRSALNDVYQSLREFVDSMPFLTSVWMVLAGRRELLDDRLRGIRSYDALWLRLQHEVAVPERFNRFGQIIDLDRAAELLIDEDVLQSLYRRVLEASSDEGIGDALIPPEALSQDGEVGRFRKVVVAARRAAQQAN